MNDGGTWSDILLRFVTSTPTFLVTVCLLPLLPLLLRYNFHAFLFGFTVIGGLAGAIIGAEHGTVENRGQARHRYGLRTVILGTEVLAVLIVILQIVTGG